MSKSGSWMLGTADLLSDGSSGVDDAPAGCDRTPDRRSIYPSRPLRRRGRVARQRPAKPCTPVRFRSAPLVRAPYSALECGARRLFGAADELRRARLLARVGAQRGLALADLEGRDLRDVAGLGDRDLQLEARGQDRLQLPQIHELGGLGHALGRAAAAGALERDPGTL